MKNRAIAAVVVTVAAGMLAGACGSSPPACQPIHRHHHKVCRVMTPGGRIVFIRWRPTVPRGYTEDNPDSHYAPPVEDQPEHQPGHAPPPVHEPPPEEHPVG